MNAIRFESRVRSLVDASHFHRDALLAPLTTFKVGGPADWLIEVHTVDSLVAILAAARECGVATTMLGGGSNVLIGDDGVRGAVLRLKLTGMSEPSPGRVRAEAGVTINGLVRWTIGRGLSALEAWAGTPGTVGGAIAGNAHYGGRNIGDFVEHVMLVTNDGTLRQMAAAEMEFAYDRSRISRTHETVVWAEFRVTSGVVEQLRGTARASLAHRKRTQPLETPSAGCIFQNPDPARDVVPPGIPPSAGALIDRAGLKGHRIGGARISPTHANFVVNDGGASARDIKTLIELAARTVRDRFGVELHEEVVRLGEF